MKDLLAKASADFERLFKRQEAPKPTTCHQCGSVAAETVCHLCGTERPAFTALKNITAKARA